MNTLAHFVLVLFGSNLYAVDLINVKDFGAKGDNTTDDTAAIQKAFDAQKTYPYGKVYFPAGRYRISDTLNMYSPNVRGESFLNTTIYQNDGDKDIFNVEFAWRGQVSDLSFNGGAKQLNMRQPFVDQGMMFVRECSFKDSSDFAIYMAPRSCPMYFLVEKCHFGNCEQVLHTVCDWTTLKDCWIKTARMKDKAAIENRGAKMLCENIVGVPIVTGKNDRWIDNYQNLTCRNFRFGGEFGGMTPVYNFAKLFKSMAGMAIVLEDCFVSASGPAVYCKEIPNSIIVRDCTLTVPAIGLSPDIDLEAYFQHVAEGVLHYDLLQNSSLVRDNAEAIALQEAASNRDTSPGSLAGQLNANETSVALEKVVAKVKALKEASQVSEEFKGHQQKHAHGEYVDIDLSTHSWDSNKFMSSTGIRNNQFIVVAQANDDIVFMRRAPNGPQGAWPHVSIESVEVDLDKTPFLTWKQKDPGQNPLPKGYTTRDEKNQLDPGIVMPSGYAVRVQEKSTKKAALLHEIHTPPWYDYRAYDLREVLGIKSGKIVVEIKYFPLGVSFTGTPRFGTAIPPEYQILDFLRLEME